MLIAVIALTGAGALASTDSVATDSSRGPNEGNIVEIGVQDEPDENGESEQKSIFVVPRGQVYCYRKPSTTEFTCVYTPPTTPMTPDDPRDIATTTVHAHVGPGIRSTSRP